MDRLFLAEWSLELPDEEFTQALAALGVLAALDRRLPPEILDDRGWRIDRLPSVFAQALERAAGVLEWRLPEPSLRASPPRVRVTTPDARRTFRVPAPPARDLATAWRVFLSMPGPGAGTPARSGPRLALRSPSRRIDDEMVMAALLARPEVGAASVFLVDTFASDGRIDWRWPFTMATLPDDALAVPFARLEQGSRPDWPFRFATASRELARIEVLVIGSGASDALARVLSGRLRIRCSLVIVAGLGDDSPRAAEPILRALVSRLSAEGAAVLEAGASPTEFATRLNGFADALSHNLTLDVALMEGFRPGALLLLNRDLLAISRLETAVARSSARLRALPLRDLSLSQQTLDRLRVPRSRVRPDDVLLGGEATSDAPSSGASPPDIADAIEASGAAYRFDHESDEASAISELSRKIVDEEQAAARRNPVARYLQQKSFRRREGAFAEERAGYVAGQAVMVQVHIGPRRDDTVAAPAAFPERRLPPSRDGHQLQVVLHEPRQFEQPLLQEIHLPRRGDSGVAIFVFTPKVDGAFEGRLSVLHRGRVLQTVLLRTMVVRPGQEPGTDAAGIALDAETQVRHDWSDLGRRRPFDMAWILNHTAAGAPLLTGVAGQRAWATDLAGVEEPVRDLNDLISKVALSVADYGDGLDQGENPALLVDLARVGADLYSVLYKDQLGQLATEGLDVGDPKVEYLQVVSARADAVVPLEFMYDFNAPDPDASVCPQHRKALEEGHCPVDCARAAKPRGYVCPLGFWGLKKVIERHLYDPKAVLPERAQVVVETGPVEAVAGRDRLDLGAGALVGHSQEVQPAEVGNLVAKLVGRLGRDVPVVKDWDEWLSTVKSRKPALLVAFPHNEGMKRNVRLEIGGEMLNTLDLPADYVRAPTGPAPVVFLLGCDVAGTAQEFSSHIRYFRQAGAAVVVSTIATVFGAHAVRVGESIVDGLLGAQASGHTRIGEAIRDAKRAALLGSLPMALCVVAFGDADWRV